MFISYDQASVGDQKIISVHTKQNDVPHLLFLVFFFIYISIFQDKRWHCISGWPDILPASVLWAQTTTPGLSFNFIFTNKQMYNIIKVHRVLTDGG